MPRATPRCWTRSSRRSQTPSPAQRMKVCAALHHGPSSPGMARYFAPFLCRQRMAPIVRRRWLGGTFAGGRQASTSGSSTAHCSSVSITAAPRKATGNGAPRRGFGLGRAPAPLGGEPVRQGDRQHVLPFRRTARDVAHAVDVLRQQHAAGRNAPPSPSWSRTRPRRRATPRQQSSRSAEAAFRTAGSPAVSCYSANVTITASNRIDRSATEVR